VRLLWSNIGNAPRQRRSTHEKLELGLTSLQLKGMGRGRPLEDRLSSRSICGKLIDSGHFLSISVMMRAAFTDSPLNPGDLDAFASTPLAPLPTAA
jgi:hypothetical protein